MSLKMTYIFLLWNLFLAFLPLLVAFAARYLLKSQVKIHLYFMIILLGLWLLFFPNAPYILTDFIHVRNLPTPMVSFDAFLIFCYAIAAFISGVLSLLFAYESFRSIFKIKESIFLIVCSFLGGLGVYLGRFLRWNSWDVFKDPLFYLKEAILQLGHPFAMKVTMVFCLLIIAGYYIMKKYMRQRV